MKALRERMGERLAEHMLRLETGQPKGHAWLAEATGESRGQVDRWLHGRTQMPAHFVLRFVDAIPTDPRWLLTGQGSPEPNRRDAERTLDAIRTLLDR